MNSSAKFRKIPGVMITIAVLIAATFLIKFTTTAHAQAGNVCYDATGLPIPCPDTPEPPPPPKPSKPKPTATPRPRPTLTPTPTETETSTPTETATATDTATATAIDTSTATTAPTGIPTKGLPTSTAIQKGGGLTQGLGMQSSNMPALQKGGAGILIIGVLFVGGFGLWRFFGKGGKSDGGFNVQRPPGQPQDQFLKYEAPDGGSNAGRESPSKQFQKADSHDGGSNAGRESPSKQFQKADSHDGGSNAGRESPSKQFQKADSHDGGSNAGRESPTNQYVKGESPPGPPVKPSDSSGL